ncbi:hypothetical protein ILYODFUR_032528 [Ilyodon furcidens]|uniref:Uncharacterized protein n=1 Tax=Ilyodon furcidens TaxID=33524 RepID=A0ABV0UX49_9TELE
MCGRNIWYKQGSPLPSCSLLPPLCPIFLLPPNSAAQLQLLLLQNTRQNSKKFTFSWKTRNVFLDSVFSVPISYSNHYPICPSLGVPQCQATGNEVFISPVGDMERGICFTAVENGLNGDKNKNCVDKSEC